MKKSLTLEDVPKNVFQRILLAFYDCEFISETPITYIDSGDNKSRSCSVEDFKKIFNADIKVIQFLGLSTIPILIFI